MYVFICIQSRTWSLEMYSNARCELTSLELSIDGITKSRINTRCENSLCSVGKKSNQAGHSESQNTIRVEV